MSAIEQAIERMLPGVIENFLNRFLGERKEEYERKFEQGFNMLKTFDERMTKTLENTETIKCLIESNGRSASEQMFLSRFDDDQHPDDSGMMALIATTEGMPHDGSVNIDGGNSTSGSADRASTNCDGG